MRLIAFDEKNQEIGDMIVYSIGGGAIRVEEKQVMKERMFIRIIF